MSSAKELCESFNDIWYKDRKEANKIAKEIVSSFALGADVDFFHRHYDRIFTNLNFSDIIYDKKIAILCFPHYEDFKPSDIVAGRKFSGSEEALVYMSLELSKMNYRVTVYANVTPRILESLKPHNPRYLPLFLFDATEDHGVPEDQEGLYDIVICWRMYDFDKARKRVKENGKIYLWLQDLPPSYIDTQHLTGVFYLSEYQRELFEVKMSKPVPYVIAGNGLMTKYYEKEKVERRKHSCFYGSNYGKGLKVLLEIWHKVLDVYPDATLDICFGRTNWATISDDELNYIVSLIEKYPSIKEHGRLSNNKVATVMKSCSIFSYPCTSATATFEITAVQAQASGCIPVVLWDYCLPEVIHSSAYHCKEKEGYLSILLEALHNEDKVDRSVFEEWGKQFTWCRVKDKWLELLEDTSMLN